MLHHRVVRRQISLEYKSCEIMHKQLARRILADDIVYILYTSAFNKGIGSNQKLQNCRVINSFSELTEFVMLLQYSEVLFS